MNQMAPQSVFSPGRIFLLPLAESQELSAAIGAAFQTCGVSRGTFSVSGTLSCVTVGVFDQKQQVYVTHRETGSLNILRCTGSVSPEPREDTPEDMPKGMPTDMIDATILATDTAGNMFGGRLFAPTLMARGELLLQELLAQPLDPEAKKDADFQHHETLRPREGHRAL